MKQLKFITPVIMLVLLIAAGTIYADQGGFMNKKGNCDPVKREAMMANQTAIMEAIKSNDYQVWSELTAGTPIAEVINQDNFARFVEMHQLQEQARQIAEELGLPRGDRGHFGFKGVGPGDQPPENTNQDTVAN